MKNRILLLIVNVLMANSMFAQLRLSPDGTVADCPGEWIIYEVTNDEPDGCLYDWEVTNGEIQGGSTTGNTSTFTGGILISIKWNNSTSDGVVKVTSRDCDNANGNSSNPYSRNIPILSLNGVTPDNITGDDEVAANITTNKVYEVAQINFPNIGSGDVSPYEVSEYEWQLPTGWTVVSGETTKKITVKPDVFSEGDIRVRGKNTVCQNGPFFTNWSPVKPVSRTVATPSAITGNNGNDFVVCGDTSPITFQVSAVAGATSYIWTKPSGWSGSSTSNNITLTPNGSNAGTISVKAKSGSYSSAVSSRTLSLELSDPNNPPTISGVSTLCTTNSTFTLQNIPTGTTVTWSVSPTHLFAVDIGIGSSFTTRWLFRSDRASDFGSNRATLKDAAK